ncbi:MAG: hypothetical protein AAFP70_01700 [Calditrichota bacterium]
MNTREVLKEMTLAAKGSLGDKWPEMKSYTESELKKLAETMSMIQKLSASDAITKKQAKLLLDIQKNTARTVMLTVEGMGLMAVEKTLDNAFAVVKTPINTLLGWKLL